jgi:hypothetical protein
MNIKLLRENKTISNIRVATDDFAIPAKDIPYFIKTNRLRNEYEYVYNVIDKTKEKKLISEEKCEIILSEKPYKFKKIIIKDNSVNIDDIKNTLSSGKINISECKQLNAGLTIMRQLLTNKTRKFSPGLVT